MLGKPSFADEIDAGTAFPATADGEVAPNDPTTVPAAVGDVAESPNMFLRNVVFTFGTVPSALLPGVVVTAVAVPGSTSPPPPPLRISFLAAFFAAFSGLGACFCLAPATYRVVM